MKAFVEAAGQNADAAVKLIIADKLEDLTRIQVEAIKNIKIDKVTVWDSNGVNDQGKTATANFLSGMLKSIPPMNELFQQAGMELPSYLGKETGEMKTVATVSEPESVEFEEKTQADCGDSAPISMGIPALEVPGSEGSEQKKRQVKRLD